MRKLILLSAALGLAASFMAPAMATAQTDTSAASSAAPAAKHKAKRRTSNCADRVMCRKLDSLSAKISTLNDSVKTGNTAQTDYFAKQGAVSDQMLTSLKAIEAQGANQQKAILLSFADRQLAEGQDAATVSNQLCVDSGFKSGKAVDVSKKGGWFSGNTLYLKSVVCTY